MSLRRDLEKRAQEAILKSIIENYRQKHTNWFRDPALRKAILNKTFFKPANALLIAGTILAAGCLPLLVLPLLFPAAPLSVLALGALAPIILGLIVEAIFLTLSFRDEEAHAQAVAELFEHEVEFKPATIQEKNLRAKVDKALEYWTLINETIENIPRGIVRENSPYDVTQQEMTEWLQAVYNLAERIDKFRLNKIIKQDLETMPATIKTYEERLAKGSQKPEVERQLQKTIADKKRQLQTLQNLQNNMEKAAYQLDSTISALGTIYSQLLLVGSKGEEGGRVNRLQAEITEQVNQLEDLTEAMDEVYQQAV